VTCSPSAKQQGGCSFSLLQTIRSGAVPLAGSLVLLLWACLNARWRFVVEREDWTAGNLSVFAERHVALIDLPLNASLASLSLRFRQPTNHTHVPPTASQLPRRCTSMSDADKDAERKAKAARAKKLASCPTLPAGIELTLQLAQRRKADQAKAAASGAGGSSVTPSVVSDVPSQRTSLSLDEGVREEIKAAVGESGAVQASAGIQNEDKSEKPADGVVAGDERMEQTEAQVKQGDAAAANGDEHKGDTEDEARVEESVGPTAAEEPKSTDGKVEDEPVAGPVNADDTPDKEAEESGPAESKSSKKKKKQKAKAAAAAAEAEAEAEAEAGKEADTTAEADAQDSRPADAPAEQSSAVVNDDSTAQLSTAVLPESEQPHPSPIPPAPASLVVDSATITNLQETVSLLIAERTDLQNQVAALTTSLNAAKAESGLLAEGRALISKLEADKADLEARLEETSRRAERVGGLEKDVADLQAQAEKKRSENERLEGEVDRLQAENEEAGKKLQEKVEELDKGLERSRQREGGLEAELGRLRSVSASYTAVWVVRSCAEQHRAPGHFGIDAKAAGRREECYRGRHEPTQRPADDA